MKHFVATCIISLFFSALQAQTFFKNKDGIWGLKDAKGKIIVQPKYYNEDVPVFVEGLPAVEVIADSDLPGNTYWGYIDKTGKEIIAAKYNWAGKFSEGFAVVMLNDKWGIITKKGKQLVPFDYDGIESFYKGFAKVNFRDSGFGFVNRQGKVVVQPKYFLTGDEFVDGVVVVIGKNDKWGAVDTTGKEVIPVKYEHVSFFAEGLAAVENDKGVYGFMNSKGEVVIPFVYEKASEFLEGLAAVKQEGKAGFINKAGLIVIPLKYDRAYSFYNGLAAVKLKDKWGFINKNGELVIAIKYDEVNSFKNGKAKVTLNRKDFYINKIGKEIK